MSQYFAFQWHITDECDQRCKHCYIFSGEGCRELKSMTWEQMQEVVANCEDFCKVYNRVPYFYITGGDPILHPDFWKLMVLLKSKDIPFTLMGNPFHLDDEICRMPLKSKILAHPIPLPSYDFYLFVRCSACRSARCTCLLVLLFVPSCNVC